MDQLAFVAFEPREDGFIASVPMEQLDVLGERPEAMLKEASAAYGRSVGVMRSLLSDFERLKANRIAIPARNVWELGNAVLELVETLRQASLELDALYEHLSRDLGINKKRLGNIVTFRRYLPNKNKIPASLHWNQCEKSARGVAEQLAANRQEPAVA